MKTSLLFAFLPLTVAGAALEPRQQASLCKKYEYWSGNGYECLNNLWGDGSATSGSQCTYVDGASNSGVKWHSKWTWNGGQNDVKSYVYCGKIVTKGRTISSITSMQTSADWSYDVNSMRCNVAYDIFTAADPNHDNSSGDYELMIWLARIGDIYPIGTSTMQVTLAGHTWDLWTGYNGQMRVFSFVAPTPVTSFSADVKEFFNWLEMNQGFPASQQNLIVYQIGTEAFTGGPATFTVNNFSADLQ